MEVDQGSTEYFQHFRVPEDSDIGNRGQPDLKDVVLYDRSNPAFKPHHKGGVTICYVNFNGRIWTGRAYCSRQESFEYSEGIWRSREKAHDKISEVYGNGMVSIEIETIPEEVKELAVI